MYQIKIRRKAAKALKALQARQRERIAESIQQLGNNPNNKALDVKPLKNHPAAQYRLRVEQYRILFDRKIS